MQILPEVFPKQHNHLEDSSQPSHALNEDSHISCSHSELSKLTPKNDISQRNVLLVSLIIGVFAPLLLHFID